MERTLEMTGQRGRGEWLGGGESLVQSWEASVGNVPFILYETGRLWSVLHRRVLFFVPFGCAFNIS